MVDKYTNSDMEIRCTMPINGHPTPVVAVPEERFDDMQRALGRLKARAVEHKLDDYVQKNVSEENDGFMATAFLKFDPIRIIGNRFYSNEFVNSIRIPDPEAYVLQEVRRGVKRLLYNMVMQDVAEHPEDYR